MLLITVALSFEAKPIIDELKLTSLPNPGFPLYANDDIALLITGAGKSLAAAGASYLYALYKDHLIEGFLNIGIAGHQDKEIGTAILANKVKDPSAQKSYYPTFIFESPIATDLVITVDHIEHEFEHKACYDMEAAGFFAACHRFCAPEQVHCFKIVSDNRLHPSSTLTKEVVKELIEKNIPDLLRVIEKINWVADKLTTITQRKEDLLAVQDQILFTSTQKKQLLKLTHRIYSLNPCSQIDLQKYSACKNAKQVIQFLEEHLSKMPIQIQ